MNRLATSSVLRSTPRRSTSILATRGYAQHKQVLFSNEGRQAMLKGVDILARAVSVTLGPKGECREPAWTSDGATDEKRESTEEARTSKMTQAAQAEPQEPLPY